MMLNDIIGMRFLLSNGHVVDTIATFTEVNETIHGWKEGKLKPVIHGTSRAAPQLNFAGGHNWAVNVANIAGICTFALVAQQTQTQSTFSPGRLYPGASGIN